MRKIVLFCAAGMSTSLLVTKMKEAATNMDYEVEINAYPLSEASEKGVDADIILLGPQVRFDLKKVQALFPEKKVEAIEMRAYGMMDGKAVITRVKQALND